MGNKRRYRLRAKKFGAKYGLKYGLNQATDQANETPEAAAIITAAPVIEEPTIVATPEPTVIAAAPDPVVEAVEIKAEPKKKRATRNKDTVSTARKTTRKRTTKAKTTT